MFLIGYSKNDLLKILNAKKVIGQVIIKKQKYTAKNILCGNLDNPQNLIFAHYDCIAKGGFYDNGLGICLMLKTIIEKPKLLKNNLFIFIANEEISYDESYDGKGFREFVNFHEDLISSCKRIIIIDGITLDKPTFTQSIDELETVFQIKNLKKYKNKIFWMHGNLKKINKVYHSDLDIY